MDKILEKLAGVLSAEDLNEVKAAFESAVEERLQSKLDEETKHLAEKADEFCQKKIQEAVAAKTKELEELANQYCEERCAKISENAQNKLDMQCKKLEEAAQQYIYEYFDEKFTEKYGEELQAIEEKVIDNLDKYLNYSINEKIDSSLIKKTAVNEMYQPIIEGIQNLFENQYVPMDCTGSKKLREAKAEIASLHESLNKQVADNMRLVEQRDAAKKASIVAEATRGLSERQAARVQKFFESKSLADTRNEIGDYVEVLSEQATAMRDSRSKLFERAKPVSRSLKMMDETTDIVPERKKSSLTESDAFLLKSAKFMQD